MDCMFSKQARRCFVLAACYDFDTSSGGSTSAAWACLHSGPRETDRESVHDWHAEECRPWSQPEGSKCWLGSSGQISLTYLSPS